MGPARFDHDCETCQFLGHAEGYDMYLCGDWKEGHLVARCSLPEYPDFRSYSCDEWRRMLRPEGGAVMFGPEVLTFAEHTLHPLADPHIRPILLAGAIAASIYGV